MKLISCKKIRIIIFVVLLLSCLMLVLKSAMDNRMIFAGLTPTNVSVTTEQLDKDIDAILGLYGLKKEDRELLHEAGDSIYDTYYKNAESNGKSIFVVVDPIVSGSSRDYTEIKTLMEMWLYIIERDFNYEIDGITYYFTAPEPESAFALLRPNEIYMSRDEFTALYISADAENLKHNKKIEVLTDAYVEKYGYKRGPGHIQVK